MQFTAVSLPTPPDDAALDHDRLVDAHNHAYQEQSYISLTFAKAACINPESYSAGRWNAESIFQATIAVTAYGSSDSAPTSAIPLQLREDKAVENPNDRRGETSGEKAEDYSLAYTKCPAGTSWLDTSFECATTFWHGISFKSSHTTSESLLVHALIQRWVGFQSSLNLITSLKTYGF